RSSALPRPAVIGRIVPAKVVGARSVHSAAAGPSSATDPRRILGRLASHREKVCLDHRTLPLPAAFSDGQSVETVWMPEGDGGEAGDGSDIGDAELREISCHPERSEAAVADERS